RVAKQLASTIAPQARQPRERNTPHHLHSDPTRQRNCGGGGDGPALSIVRYGDELSLGTSTLQYGLQNRQPQLILGIAGGSLEVHNLRKRQHVNRAASDGYRQTFRQKLVIVRSTFDGPKSIDRAEIGHEQRVARAKQDVALRR